MDNIVRLYDLGNEQFEVRSVFSASACGIDCITADAGKTDTMREWALNGQTLHLEIQGDMSWALTPIPEDMLFG